MNETLVRNWNDTVDPDDIVYILGDFAMGKIADTLPTAGLLNGKKLLIPGNHDRCWTGHKKIGQWKEKYEQVGFSVFPNQIRLPINSEPGGSEVLLCHFPYEGDSHDEDRYVGHRPFDDGTVLFHGHTHSPQKHTVSKSGTPMFNVGVDANNYRPVSIQQLLAA